MPPPPCPAIRRAILEKLLPRNDHVSLSAVGKFAAQMLKFVKQHGMEGVVVKRADFTTGVPYRRSRSSREPSAP